MTNNVEIGKFIDTCGYRTNYHDAGTGPVVLMLHGSGAGVSSWANWRGIMPVLSQNFRVVMPDLVGFGYTETPADFEFKFMTSWTDQILAFMDGLGLEKVHVVGNSFGGALTMWLVNQWPERFERLVLMGSAGVAVEITPGLDQVWGYTPSLENMKNIMTVMAYDRSLVTDELAGLRYKASMRPGAQETFAKIFPAPRQRWLDALALPVAAVQKISHETLIIHGRDDRVIPPEISQRLHQMIKNSQLHMFGNCGHWTQIEKADRFQKLVEAFFTEAL